MALPRNIRPEYSTTVPSSGKRIKYQPFSVREEKVLVLAAESQNPEEITNAVSNVIRSCITSPADFDVSELALFDVEYIFLKARSKSIGEKIKLRLTDPEDETYTVDHELAIDKISVTKDKDHSDLVTLSDTISVKMRYPDISFFNDGINLGSITQSTSLVARCISSIVIDDEVYNRADMSDTEVTEWIEGLTSGQFQSIIKFFETMPKLKHKITLKNKNTDKNFTINLEGLADFF